jgi:hypothetical protein
VIAFAGDVVRSRVRPAQAIPQHDDAAREARHVRLFVRELAVAADTAPREGRGGVASAVRLPEIENLPSSFPLMFSRSRG